MNAFKQVGWRVVMVGAVTVLGSATARTLRINLSDSLPRGLYRVVAATPGRGDLVTACPPLAAARLARERGYLLPGGCPGGVEPLGKRVLAMAGDTVAVTLSGLVVNGSAVAASASHSRDPAGRLLPQLSWSTRRLAAGELWLYAPHPRSFDSRYFGPVAATAVRERIAPLWTWPAAPP